MAKQIPLGAQATVAVETVDVLRKHGLKGVYGIVLRKEFLAAADLLCKVTGINKRSWPLSVHELSAAIFYALAEHRALRGNDPEKEEWLHTLKTDSSNYNMVFSDNDIHANGVEDKNDRTISNDFKNEESNHNEDIVDEHDEYDPMEQSYADLLLMADLAIKAKNSSNGKTGKGPKSLKSFSKIENRGGINNSEVPSPSSSQPSLRRPKLKEHKRLDKPKNPVCEPVTDSLLSSLLFYAPIAMNFIYCTNAVDMQLLAAQQNWNLLYAHLEQDATLSDRPASALFIHKHQKIACFAVRGTATINDVVTDIRAMPVPFPDKPEPTTYTNKHSQMGPDADWMPVDRGQGLALCGMARSAGHLFRENMDTLVMLVEKGYRIRITGHSLGGGVAALLGALIRQYLEKKTESGDSLTDSIHGQPNMSNNKGNLMEQNDLLRVYTYAIPACGELKHISTHLLYLKQL